MNLELLLSGAIVRFIQGLFSAVPTLFTGLFIAAVFRYYLRAEGTVRLFGGGGFRSLFQSWLIGMLLPVCSIGVLPILRELRRMGLRPGAITAFALSAPLFNPLSLLYGLTLSRPYVIVGFALGSLLVVTLLGMGWDRFNRNSQGVVEDERSPISLRRLGFVGLYMLRELVGPTGALSLVALLGLAFLAVGLQHGALQTSVEQDDPWAPLRMAAVAIPIYATPMLTMSQLGMMFVHGNSPGAAFCLLLLGTGMNLATLFWIASNYGWRSTSVWMALLLTVVVGCAYVINKPLVPPGVQPAGHTHAFDIYTNPFPLDGSPGFSRIPAELGKSLSRFELMLGLSVLGSAIVLGLLSRTVFSRQTLKFLAYIPEEKSIEWTGIHRKVSATTLGVTILGGLIAFSIVGCYAYYPAPSETLEEMRLARVNVLSGVMSRDWQQTLHHIPELEDWSRMLEVGYFIRHFELRPYQRMQCHLLRKKLELLEHACEDMLELDAGEIQNSTSSVDREMALQEVDALRHAISQNASRIYSAFQPATLP